ncbi:MAG: hypothetical protein KME64_18875 [Scytonematopsis contorta HA4267-MV1]|nr:hypothetical protein [Scytonematopsis contorta HA4267-MV1]
MGNGELGRIISMLFECDRDFVFPTSCSSFPTPNSNSQFSIPYSHNGQLLQHKQNWE